MKVLLIGGSGILSTAVCSESINKGYDVYLLNRGKRKYALNSKAKLILGDIHGEEIDVIRQKIKGLRFDVVIDFLAFKPDDIKKHLEILKDCCDQYVFISSATVYKKMDENETIREDTTTVGNLMWKYASNKTACELYLKQNYKAYCKHWTIIRPYVTYNETRIPYALINGHAYWSIVNRVLKNKPIVLWDGGAAKCTITHAHDFAVGVVGLMMNPYSYEEAFHITSDYVMNWREVVNEEIKAIGKDAEIMDIDSPFIIRVLPEYAGVLLGDKGTNMVFDNSKIKEAVPEFKSSISFSDGIKETISFLRDHKELQTIDYRWEGRMDYLIIKYCKKNGISYKDKIGIKSYNEATRKDKLLYFAYRNILFYRIDQFRKLLMKVVANEGYIPFRRCKHE